MKKFLLILVLSILFLGQPVSAKNVKVEAMSDFSTANPPKTWSVKVTDGFVMKNGTDIKSGTILKGNIIQVSDPKRLKRNATFKFELSEYTDPDTGQVINIDTPIIGKYSSLSDVSPLKVAEQGAVMAGNKLVGAYVGPSVALVKGAVKNEEGNVAKSALVSVYESTPLSLCNKGQELEFVRGDTFVMNFKLSNEPDDEDDI